MRTKDAKPAVCPHCKQSFESAGKNRYHNLKRHIETVHPMKGVNINTNNGIGVMHDGVILNIHFHINTITESDYSGLKKCIHEIMEECKGGAKALIPEMMMVLHDTNGNVVVPNKNKDEVLIKVGESKVETVTVHTGARLCTKAFIEDGAQKVEDVLNDDEKGVIKEKIDKIQSRGERGIDDVSKLFAQKLKSHVPNRRRKIAKMLYDDIHPSDY